MRIKLLGVGKCGSRLCYDFFAQIRGLPSSYEIRAEQKLTGLRKVLDLLIKRTGVRHLRHNLRMQWEALTGTELLRDAALYAIVDSDLDNNEVAGQLEVLAADGQALAFPGRPYSLNGLAGGCQYHIISEREVHRWKNMPEELLAPEGSEILAFAFSTAGGTGGGAGPALAAASRDPKYVETRSKVIHRMGIAVLPQSDEPYFVGEYPSEQKGVATPPMDLVEKYNVGRFFVSSLGGRDPGTANLGSLNGTWLVSNDLLRAMLHDASAGVAETGADKALDSRWISLINSYVGLALCTLCNASSRATLSYSDLDPRELNNHLTNRLYISAFGYAERTSGENGENLVRQVQELLRRALCGSRIIDGQLQGVSVPLSETCVAALASALKVPASTFGEFQKGLDEFAVEKGPREFRTARRIVAVLGHPQSASNNPVIADATKAAVNRIFSNSESPVWYYHKHSGHLDYLLLFIVDPFVPVIVNSMFDYIARTWLRDSSNGPIIDNYLKGAVQRESLKEELLAEDEIQHLPEALMGNATEDLVGRDGLIPFGPEVVISALDRVRDVLRWKKPATHRFSG